MSYSYGFVIVLASSRWPTLVEALAAWLCADDVPPLRHVWPATVLPAAGLLSFSLPADTALQAFAERHPDVARDRPDRICLGYVDWRLQRCEGGLQLSLHSSAHDVAEALRDSSVLRNALLTIAAAVPVDRLDWLDEWGDGGRLWPPG